MSDQQVSTPTVLSEAMQLQWEIEQFLFKEARLLDNRKFNEWLELWTMDCRYHVPVRRNKAAKVGQGIVDIDDELSLNTGAAWVDDDKMLMFARVMRLQSGKAWSENPLARTRRFVSNVEVASQVTHEEQDDALLVYSNLLQFRSRREDQENLFSCQRRDLILRTDQGLQIRERTVVLDSNVLTSSYATFL